MRRDKVVLWVVEVVGLLMVGAGLSAIHPGLAVATLGVWVVVLAVWQMNKLERGQWWREWRERIPKPVAKCAGCDHEVALHAKNGCSKCDCARLPVY